MSQQTSSNSTKWIIGIVAAVVILCGAVFLCSVAGVASYFLGRRQESQVYRNFPGIPIVPELLPEGLPEEVQPDRAFPFEMPQQVNGALIQRVMPGSPADAAGMRAGDLVTAIDGKLITPQQSLADLISSYEPGDTVTVTYLRFGGARRGQFDAQIELGENPNVPGAAYLGVEFMELFMEP